MATSVLRPKAYLNINGCVNVFGPDISGLATVTVRSASGRQILVHFNEERIAELDSIFREFDVDWMFLSTWLTEPGLIDQLVDGLNGLLQGGKQLSAPKPRMKGFTHRWKVHSLIRDLRENGPTPFSWIDDQIVMFRAQARNTFDVPSLLLQPNTDEGISSMHLRSLRQFYSGLTNAVD